MDQVECPARADDSRDTELAREYRGVRHRPAVGGDHCAGDREDGVERRGGRPDNEHITRFELFDRVVGRAGPADATHVRVVADPDAAERVVARDARIHAHVAHGGLHHADEGRELSLIHI